MALGITQSSQALSVYGLSTRDQLIEFDSATPNTLRQSVFINGLANNESLVGIDFRPANNRLYGLGSFGRIYTIDTLTGQAQFQFSLTNSVGGGPVALSGVEFGVDFNPAADRLRITSNQGQNLRINVDTGVTIVDGTLNGSATFIVASAYINNDNDAMTGTALYNVDSNQDVLTLQNPPNSGGQTIIGALGTDVSALAGMDIYTMGTSNTAYGAFQMAGNTGSGFYSVNLATGAATSIGFIGGNQSSDALAIRDIAVNPVPEPATLAVLAIGAAMVARRKKKA